MATDGLTPQPCDPNIFKNGKPIALLRGSSNAIENWVQMIANKTSALLDWHYSGGFGQVLHLGKNENREIVISTMKAHELEFNGRILRYIDLEDAGLYRMGVNRKPKIYS